MVSAVAAMKSAVLEGWRVYWRISAKEGGGKEGEEEEEEEEKEEEEAEVEKGAAAVDVNDEGALVVPLSVAAAPSPPLLKCRRESADARREKRARSEGILVEGRRWKKRKKKRRRSEE